MVIMKIIQIKALCYGRVQGVGFRSFVKKTANQIGLRGYVMNLSDGSVEIMAEGNSDSIQTFVEKIKNAPFPINVEKIKLEKREISNYSFPPYFTIK